VSILVSIKIQMSTSGRKPFGQLSANVGNRPEARTLLLSPKPQSLRFRDLLSRSSTDPAWARRVRTALCGAEQTLMLEFISELASVLAALFASAPPSADLYALVTHVLAVRCCPWTRVCSPHRCLDLTALPPCPGLD